MIPFNIIVIQLTINNLKLTIMKKVYLAEFHYEINHTSIIGAYSEFDVAMKAALDFADVNGYGTHRVSVLCLVVH